MSPAARRAQLIGSLLVAVAIVAVVIAVVTARFGSTPIAELDAQEERIEAQQEAAEERADAREERIEEHLDALGN